MIKVTGFLERLELWAEVINLIIGIIIMVICAKTYVILEGRLEKNWVYILMSAVLFFIHEIIGVLKEFEVLTVPLIYELTEFLFVITMTLAIYKSYTLFRDLRKNK